MLDLILVPLILVQPVLWWLAVRHARNRDLLVGRFKVGDGELWGERLLLPPPGRGDAILTRAWRVDGIWHVFDKPTTIILEPGLATRPDKRIRLSVLRAEWAGGIHATGLSGLLDDRQWKRV